MRHSPHACSHVHPSPAGADRWQADYHGACALHYAAKGNHVSTIEELLKDAADRPSSLAASVNKSIASPR